MLNDGSEDIEEEIKEEIEVETDTNPQLQCTYDKFLLESVALNNKPQNQCQNILKNQMKEIITDIKQEKIETLKNKNSLKRQILKDLNDKFSNFHVEPPQPQKAKIEKNEKEEDNIICNVEQTRFVENPQFNETKNRENTLLESFQESQDKVYNINIEEFIKDNTQKVDIDNMNNIKSEGHSNHSNYLNQNDTVENPFIHPTDNTYNNSFQNNNVSVNNTTVHGNPYLQQKIKDNYNQFLMNSQKNNQITGRFNALNNNNGMVKEKDQRLILVDSCTNDEERLMKQQKIERLRQKKLKELEDKNRNIRKKSKSKPTIHNNNNNSNQNELPNINPSISSKRKIMNQRPSTAKNNSNLISNQSNSSKIRPNTSKNNISNMSNNISSVNSAVNDSNMSRIPIKIKREECIIANQKVKNVKYSKMSNKNTIKKAIREVCLAGPHYKDSREKIIEIIDNCTCENYIILFKGDYGFYLNGVYTYDSQNKQIELLTCINNAPNFIDSTMVAKYYKYNISQNQFKELGGNKGFSVIVDGITLMGK